MSEKVTVTDWREFVEERTTLGAEVLYALYHNGIWYGLVQKDGDVYAVVNSLILKPQPKTTRPWTPDEVPVGAVVKCKQTGYRAVLINTSDEVVTMSGRGQFSTRTLHDDYLLEITRPSPSCPAGVYGLCGMEENNV